MQVQADEHRANLEQTEFDLNDDEVDWGPGYDARLARMKENASQQPLRWVFVIDDCTHAFAAVPVRAAELDVPRLANILDAVWTGKHGMIRTSPAELSLPSAYDLASSLNV